MQECKNNVIFEAVWFRPTQIILQDVFSMCLCFAVVMWWCCFFFPHLSLFSLCNCRASLHKTQWCLVSNVPYMHSINMFS